MSEPRKLNTDGAEARRSVLDHEQYEEARRRAQAASAMQGGRRSRRIQTPGTRPPHPAEQPATEQPPVVEQPAAPAPEPVRQEAPAQQQELTRAQQQAIALQQAAAQRRAAASQPRTINRTGRTGSFPAVRQLDLTQSQGRKPAYDMSKDTDYVAMEQRRAQKAAAQAAAVQAAVAAQTEELPAQKAAAPAQQPQQRTVRQAPRQSAPPKAKPAPKQQPAKKAEPKPDSAPRGRKGKGESAARKKKKGGWWKILLITLLVLGLIFGGTLFFIKQAIAPEAGGISLSQLINTPKELQDKEFNFVMVGIDRSTSGDTSAGAANETGANDGLTDMILYVHFNNETGEMKMLQIPRDLMVTNNRAFSNNYRINAIATTQAVEANTMNMPALCEHISAMYDLPVDGYVTIRLEMLVELVDLFGGIELYVPQDMDYEGSHLSQGYQTLDGAACEFLLRTRKIYADSDIGRLNMQRQFYSALFRRLKSIGNVFDVAKLAPAVLNYMETDISISKLVSFAVSLLKIDSNKIMICQMPVKMGPTYNGESLVYAARQEAADLLNTYFRENTGPVDASALQLCDDPAVLGFDPTALASTDPNVQYMGALNDQAAQAQQEQNLDNSHQVEYVDPVAESTDTGGEEQPAA